MIVVGIGGFFHDFNAAALCLESGRVAAAEEERFSRRKHHPVMGTAQTSVDCLRYVLDEVGAGFGDVAHVAFSDLADHPLKSFLRGLFPRARFHDVHHQMCHAAAAYYSSGWRDGAAILALDGFGDDSSGVLAVGEGHRLRPLRYVDIANSIGLEYLRVTYQIGMGAFGAEGKTQGLAPYGTPRFLDDYLREVVFRDDGTVELSDRLRNMKGYLGGELYLETKSLFNDFIADHVARRFDDEPLEQPHIDMAASVQALLDRVAVHAAGRLRAETGADQLVLGGGVALNSTMNGVVRRQAGFRDIRPHPSASDRGNGLGAALYVANTVLDQPFVLDQPLIYAGRRFDDEAVEAAIRARSLPLEAVEDPAVAAAALLAEGAIIGWFQGRSELGARALGSRSILADPRRAEMKDDLNRRVKHREWFRPFAPAVPIEHASIWFDLDGPLPHMTETVKIRAGKGAGIAAACHVDETARVQTVRQEDNPLYHRLLQDFGRRTGVPVVINTSFNDADEPIVDTPDDALNCLEATDLDFLVMGRFLVPGRRRRSGEEQKP